MAESELEYGFSYVDSSIFTTLNNKEYAEKFMMWGLDTNMSFHKFRFDHVFDPMQLPRFVSDFVNSTVVR